MCLPKRTADAAFADAVDAVDAKDAAFADAADAERIHTVHSQLAGTLSPRAIATKEWHAGGLDRIGLDRIASSLWCRDSPGRGEQ